MDLGDWFLEVNGRKVGPFTLDQIQGLLNDGEIRSYHQVTSKELKGRWISVEEMLEKHAPPQVSDELPPPPPPPSADIPDITVVAPLKARKGEPVVASPVVPPTVRKDDFRTKPDPLAEHDSSQHHIPYIPEPDAPSIAELAANYAPDAAFQPPPRPELETNIPPPTGGSDLTNPALSLFDALQVVRERQVASFQPPAVKQGSRKALFKVPTAARMGEVTREVQRKFTKIRESLPLPEKIPPRMWAAAALAGVVLGSLSMGVFRMLKPKMHPSPGSLTQVSGLHPNGSGPISHAPIEPPTHALPPARVPTITTPPAENPLERARAQQEEQRKKEEERKEEERRQQEERRDDRQEADQQPRQGYQPGQPMQPRQPYDPNNPYAQQEMNGMPPNNGGAIPPQQQEQQYDQYGNPIAPAVNPVMPAPGQPAGVDAQGNPIPGYIPPQGVPGNPGYPGNPGDPNQIPQPGQPGAPGQDSFQPGMPQQ